MKKTTLMMWIAALALSMALVGCTKETATGPGGDPSADADKQAVQSMVIQSDSVAEYSSSDESSIDDNGMRNPDYEGLAKIGFDSESISGVSGDSTYPVKWGRRIFWDRVVRSYTVTTIGDSLANVLITKTLPGAFWVGIGTRTADTVIIDTIIRKPFVETVKRNVLFRRIARLANPLRNWIPIGVTMVEGKTDGTNDFSIASVEITERNGSFHRLITDPLDTWFRLGFFHGSIPFFPVRDSILVRVTVQSSNEFAEGVYLRHGIDGGNLARRRGMMPLVSTTGGAGNYTRVYERTFVTSLPPFVLISRFNAVVDVISHGSVYDNDAPFMNEFWGMPYIVARR